MASKNLNEELRRLYPGPVIEELIRRDHEVRQDKARIFSAENFSKSSREEVRKAISYLKVQKTMLAQKKIPVKSYLTAITYCEKLFLVALEEINQGVLLKDIKNAEKLIAGQSRDGLLSSISRLQEKL